MNSNMRLFLELVANASGAKRELTDTGRAVSRFAQGARREFDAMKRAAGSLQGQLAGIGATVTAVKVMMDSAGLDKSLTQITQTAGEGSGKVSQLRSELFRMGRESGKPIEGLKDGVNDLVQAGLNLKEALPTLDAINTAMAVTDARANTLAGGLTVAAQAFQFDLAQPGKALELLDKMTVAGRQGNAELQNLSDIFGRVGPNAAAAGMGFDKTLAFIEALSKTERNPERLATLADSTLRLFTNGRYMAEAQKATGVNFFGADGSRRDPVAVLKDLKRQYDALGSDKARAGFMQKAFGKADLDTIKGLRILLSGNSLADLQEFERRITGASGTLKRDVADATRNLVDQAGILKNDLRQAADGFVQPINETLAHFIQFMRDTKANGGWELDGKDMILGAAGGLLGTAALARYGSRSISAIASRMLGKGTSLAVGAAEGKILEAAAGITPVFVTNWPAGGTVPGNAGGVGPTGIGVGAAGSMFLPAGVATAAGAAGMWAGKSLTDWQVSKLSDRDLQSIYARQMVMGGGPFSYQAQAIDREFASRGVKNDIRIDLTVDGNGRVSSRSNSLDTRITTVPRGVFFDATPWK